MAYTLIRFMFESNFIQEFAAFLGGLFPARTKDTCRALAHASARFTLTHPRIGNGRPFKFTRQASAALYALMAPQDVFANYLFDECLANFVPTAEETLHAFTLLSHANFTFGDVVRPVTFNGSPFHDESIPITARYVNEFARSYFEPYCGEYGRYCVCLHQGCQQARALSPVHQDIPFTKFLPPPVDATFDASIHRVVDADYSTKTYFA